jgi:hypothetical protein
MEFLVGFDVTVPDGTPESEVNERVDAEATARTPAHRAAAWRELHRIQANTRSVPAPRSRPQRPGSVGSTRACSSVSPARGAAGVVYETYLVT